MARYTAELSATTYLQNHQNDATIGRLCLDLGLGETTPVTTEKWDWFKRPAELSAEASSLMLAHTATADITGPMPAQEVPSKHGPAPGRPNAREIIDRVINNVYGRTFYDTLQEGIDQIAHMYTPAPELSPEQVSALLEKQAARQEGFVSGMISSLPYRQPPEPTPLERLAREEALGEYALFAPKSEQGVASHYTLPELRVLNSRHNEPRDPEADAKLVPLGMAHRRGLRERVRRVVGKPLAAVRSFFGKRKADPEASQLAAAIRREEQWLADYDRNYSSDNNPYLDNASLGTNPFLQPIGLPREQEDAFVGEPMTRPAEPVWRSRHGSLDDIGFGLVA